MKTYIYPENLRANLRRNNSVGCDSGELLERPALCCDRLLCVSLSSGRRNFDHRLYF